MPEFKSWSKIPRLQNETCYITEKIDGSNGLIAIENNELYVGSRSRWITPENDNFGFAKWAHTHKEDLLQLGDGFHYGEWYGCGINRNYGLDHKRFALFYVAKGATKPECCDLVPTLEICQFNTAKIEIAVCKLRWYGSVLVPGFMKPEGIIVYCKESGKRYKVLCDNDDKHKNHKNVESA